MVCFHIVNSLFYEDFYALTSLILFFFFGIKSNAVVFPGYKTIRVFRKKNLFDQLKYLKK